MLSNVVFRRVFQALLLQILVSSGMVVMAYPSSAGQVSVTNISSYDTTCEVLSTGNVACWGGQNQGGSLGNGTSSNSSAIITSNVPVPAIGVTGASKVFTFGGSCAVISLGAVMCWGSSNYLGGLHDPSNRAQSSAIPVLIPGITGVTQIVGDDTGSCVLFQDTTVSCWGTNENGQLGNNGALGWGGQISNLNGVIQISASGKERCALLSNHSVQCWGYIGVGNSLSALVPTTVANLSNVSSISSGHTTPICAISSGNVYCIGAALSVSQVPNVSNATSVDGNCALISGGTIQCWSYNSGSLVQSVQGISHAIQLSGNCALLSDGSVACWGDNTYGQLGNGSSVASTSSAVSALSPSVPYSPTSVTTTVSVQSINVNWSAPTYSGSYLISSYVATATSGGNSFTCTSSTTSCVITGLANGTSYSVTVSAINQLGSSPNSLISSALTPTFPSPPTNPYTYANSKNSFNISWATPSSNGGSPITGYTATATGGGSTITCSTSSSSCLLSNLASGVTYTASVVATNAVGNSGPSTVQTFTTPTAPSAPSLSSATPGNKLVIAVWAAPSTNGGLGNIQYTVTANGGTGPMTCTTTSLTCTITGLQNGSNYSLSLIATNGVGPSVPSNALSATPIGSPLAPTSVLLSSNSQGVTIKWTVPLTSSSNGAAESFTGALLTCTNVACSNPQATNQSCATTGSTANSCSIAAPVSSQFGYVAQVSATNGSGTGDASAVSNVLSWGAPTLPSNISAVLSKGVVTISWQEPSTGNGTFAGYRVSVTPLGSSTETTTCSSSSTTSCPVQISVLTPGNTYSIVVSAKSSLGTTNSLPYSWSMANLPGPPTGVTATGGQGSATISWNPPLDTVDGPFTGYVVKASPGNGTCSTSSLQCTVSGLTAGTRYVFTVSAINSVGTGENTEATAAAIPTAAPRPATTTTIKKPVSVTINCYKGKILKKVTGAKPVCPAGFKKK